MAKLRETPISDVMTKNGKLRIDGRLVRDQAYRPLAETGCPLVQKAEAKWRPRSHPVADRHARSGARDGRTVRLVHPRYAL